MIYRLTNRCSLWNCKSSEHFLWEKKNSERKVLHEWQILDIYLSIVIKESLMARGENLIAQNSFMFVWLKPDEGTSHYKKSLGHEDPKSEAIKILFHCSRVILKWRKRRKNNYRKIKSRHFISIYVRSCQFKTSWHYLSFFYCYVTEKKSYYILFKIVR